MTAIDELGALVRHEAAEADIPGMAVGVTIDGVDHVVVHGVTNVEHPLPVDRRTLFQIGSTTKTFTATAAMRLVEQGQLSLDDRVIDHLPGFRLADDGHGAMVTVRHLLTHTGGWAGDWFLLTEPDYGRDGALAQVATDMWQAPQVLPPGEAFSYNNAGFYVLGRLVEVLTGLPYPDAVHKLVLAPAGLTHSFFYADEMVTHRVAAGHTPGEGGPKVHRPWPRPFYAWPAGALCSCADDLLAWARFWAGDGRGPEERVLETATMTAMTTPQLPIDSRTSIGLAWMLQDVGGLRLIEHGGATNGYLTVFAMRPEAGFALVIMANSTAAAAANRRIERWVIERVLGVTEEDTPPAAGVSTETLAEYRGQYGLGPAPEWAHRIEVADADGEEATAPALVLVAGTPGGPDPAPRFRLQLCAGNEVVCVDPASAAGLRGTFGRRADGTIGWVRFGLRVYNRVESGPLAESRVSDPPGSR